MQSTFNPALVTLSIVVAVLASYTALSLAARVAASSAALVRFWLIGGAIAMGVRIWSMHFIGMMAFSLPIALRRVKHDRGQLTRTVDHITRTCDEDSAPAN